MSSSSEDEAPARPPPPVRKKPVAPVATPSDSDDDDWMPRCIPASVKTSSSSNGSSGQSTSASMVVSKPLSSAATLAPSPEPASDTIYVLNKLKAMREEVQMFENEDNDNFERVNVWTPGYDPMQSRVHLGSTLDQLLKRDDGLLTYAEYAQAGDVANLQGSRGGGEDGDFFLHKTNRETRTLDFCIENAEYLMSLVPPSTSKFPFTPEQRLVIGYNTILSIDVDIEIAVRKASKYGWREKDVAHERAGRNEISRFSFWTIATGNGKTVMAITAMMTRCCNPEIWKDLNNKFPMLLNGILQSRNAFGYYEGPSIAKHELARVVIAFVPDNVLNQWYETALEVAKAMQQTFGYSFEVWDWKKKLKRKAKKDDVSIDRTMGEAHALNKPLLWIVRAETGSAKYTIRSDPHIHYVARINDEATSPCEPRDSAPESQALFYISLQAAMQRLKDSTYGAPRHALRLALHGRNFDPGRRDHSAKFAQASTPHWQRKLLWMGISHLMPGIHRYNVKVNFKTLAGRVSGSDLNLTGLDQLLSSMMNLRKVGGMALDDDTRLQLLERCKQLLTFGEGGIVTRLETAIKDADEQIIALGKSAEFENERAALRTFIRMFDNLREAIECDPPPEDPMDLEPIPKAKMIMLRCCSQIMNKDNVQYCFNRCPNCRQPMDENSGIGLEAAVEMVDNAAASAAANAKQVEERMRQRAAQEAEEAAKKEALRAKALGNDEILSTRLQDLTKKKLAGMFDYISEVLHAVFDFKPNARVLLAFCMFGENTEAAHRSVEKQLRGRCDRFETIGFCKDHGRAQIATYTDKSQTARILAINTNNGSKSLEGINLGDTDLVIFDRTGGGDRLNGVLTQGIGRAVRPQALPSDHKWGSPIPNFPDKKVVYLTRGHRAAADNDSEE